MTTTRGTVALDGAGVAYRLMRYRYGGGGADEAAQKLGIEPERMFKSLVVRAGEAFVFALLPATAELSTKRLAAAAGAKSAAMAERRDAERVTGYQIGGISPLGSRRPLPVFLDASAAAHARICLNAGARGHIAEVDRAALVALTGARLAPLAA